MAGPLSVDEILAKQRAEKEAAAKPKFLTKAERTKLALEKRAAEVQEQQAKEDAERFTRAEFDKAAEEERRRTADAGRYGGGNGYGSQGQNQGQNGNGGLPYGQGQNGNGGYGGNQNGRPQGGFNRNGQGQGQQGGYGGPQNGHNGSRNDRGPPAAAPSGPAGNGPPTGPRGMPPPSGPRAAAGASTSNPASAPTNGSSSSNSPSRASQPGDLAPLTDDELWRIRARHLGQKVDQKKPRVRQEGNKKFVFDWKADEDTSGHNPNPVMDGKGLGPGGVMLGGNLAGYDGASKDGVIDKHADALERRRAGRGTTDERHWSDKPLGEMKDRDWRIFREDFSIQARGGSIPLPLRSWRESDIPGGVLDVIDEVGYTEPSPIQRQAIPIGMQNRDLIGIAKTGSGKTAAFVIPMLAYIGHLGQLADENRHLGPYALILAPTRELAQQIESETAKFASRMGYTSVSIIGGRSVEEQQFALRNGAEIIIATPGRLKDMIDKSMIVLSQCRYVVMDEADRMVDLGFELDLNFILDAMPATLAKPEDVDEKSLLEFKGWRVTTLFSATMPAAVDRLARKYLRKPATVTIGIAGEAVDTVEHRVEFIEGEEKKKSRLIELFRNLGLPPPMIVFVNQKRTADVVVKYVHQAGMSAITLHSDKTQVQREAALQSLRDGEVSVLVATDIAGRGIDVPDVSVVINWQMADSIERWVHRVGRTGRAGKRGLSITFLSNSDDEVMYDLKQEIAKSPLSIMNPELARHDAAKQRITKEMKRKREEEGMEE